MRTTVLFSGHVQGVGFRYTTARLAGHRRVTGYVRNLPDGRVELVAEGSPGEIDGLIADIEEAMSGCIRDRQVARGPETGEFHGFTIRH